MFRGEILHSMWHIHSARLRLCWNGTGTQQWHVHRSERREEEREPAAWQARHQSSSSVRAQPARHRARSWAVTFHRQLIRNMKTVRSAAAWWLRYVSACLMRWVPGRSWTGQRSSCCSGDAELQIPRQTVICYSPHVEEKKTPGLFFFFSRADWLLRKTTAGFQWGNELFVTKQIVTNCWQTQNSAPIVF